MTDNDFIPVVYLSDFLSNYDTKKQGLEALGVSRQAAHRWKHEHKGRIPGVWAFKAQALLSGRLSASEEVA